MDTDCEDVFDDPVCTFMAGKLKRVREANQQLRGSIEQTKRTVVRAEAANVDDEDRLIAGAARKRYHNGKWCFVVNVSSLDPTAIYDDFDVTLKWLQPSPPIAPQYTLTIHSAGNAKDAVRPSREISVIVAFESMPFVQHDKYAAEAALCCTAAPRAGAASDGETCSRRVVRLGTFAMSAAEANDDAHVITNVRLIAGQKDDALAVRACSARIELAVVLQTGKLRDYLVVECRFRELELDGEQWFLLDANVGHLDGCCLECVAEEGVDLVTLYVRDRAHLNDVLHHLHSNIPGATILPRECKGRLQRERRDEDMDEMPASQARRQDVKKFGACLLRQIDSVIEFHRNVLCDREPHLECDVTEEYRVMRNAVTQFELGTDFLYEQLNSA